MEVDDFPEGHAVSRLSLLSWGGFGRNASFAGLSWAIMQLHQGQMGTARYKLCTLVTYGDRRIALGG